ncbi:IS3 family transposase, partial [Ruegeria atlantica]|uniref:IS3 family transposase n=1 Tax=Ruegeria atlantica TaxID=81569 RepID=UPI0032B4F071
RLGVHPTMIHQLKWALLEGASGVFECSGRNALEVNVEQIRGLHAKIRELVIANKFLAKKAQTLDRQVRRKTIEPRGESEMNLNLMRVIGMQFLETPFFGVRKISWHLRNEDLPINEKGIQRLMRLMSLMPINQKPNTNKAAKGHKIYPYLLQGLRVDRAP